jgi:hypothetical protein
MYKSVSLPNMLQAKTEPKDSLLFKISDDVFHSVHEKQVGIFFTIFYIT